jgi:glycosyltransferase involved in cell wall biosynthesis
LTLNQPNTQHPTPNTVFAAAKTVFLAVLVLAVAPFIRCCLWLKKPGSTLLPRLPSSTKIAYLRTDFWFGAKAGGSVSHIAGFAGGITELGHRLFFLSSDGLPGVDICTNPVFVIQPVNCPRRIPQTLQILAYNITFFLKSIPILQRERPDVICQRHSELNICGVLLSLLFGIPFMLEYNSSAFWKRESKQAIRMLPVLRLFERINLSAAHRVGVVSVVLKEELSKRIPASRIFVNENGVDPKVFSGDIDGSAVRERLQFKGQVVVGFAGIYGPWHGVEHLAGAIRHAAKRPELHFLFIGDERLKEVVRSIAGENGTSERLTFVDAVPHHEIPAYLAACDILCSPHVNMADGSRFFGSPVKLFEYMAMAKPIVASSVEQLSHVLQDGQSAILVPAGNPLAIAEAILTLADDEMLRDRLARAARERCVHNFTWKHNAERFINNCF